MSTPEVDLSLLSPFPNDSVIFNDSIPLRIAYDADPVQERSIHFNHSNLFLRHFFTVLKSNLYEFFTVLKINLAENITKLIFFNP